jgi:plastocyanin
MNFIRTSSLKLLITAMVLFLFISGCSKADDNLVTQGANDVWAASSMFDPVSMTVPINTTVKWTNWDSYEHTITSDSKLFDSGNISPKGTFTYQFKNAGTYKYHCTLHPEMIGSIIVQ